MLPGAQSPSREDCGVSVTEGDTFMRQCKWHIDGVIVGFEAQKLVQSLFNESEFHHYEHYDHYDRYEH